MLTDDLLSLASNLKFKYSSVHREASELCECLYLYVSFVGTLVSVHALHSGLFALPHVDTEERPSSHWIFHTGVVRWQIHPTNDEEPVHLSE